MTMNSLRPVTAAVVVVLFTVLQAQRACAVEAQGGTVSGGKHLSVTYTGAGKPYSVTASAASGSNSDTAVLTVVSTGKILAGGEEGPVMVLEGDAVQLEAIPYPSGETYPAACPVWSVNLKPAGSSTPKPPDGDKTVSVTPDKLGKYKILADYTSIDLYSYRFEFEEDMTTHASIEGHLTDGTKVQEGGKDKNFVGIYGSFSDTPKPNPTKTSISIFFSMTSNGAGFLADPQYPLAKELQPSGERRYDIYLNVGDAQGLDVTTSVNWGTIVDMTPTSKPPIERGAHTFISHKGAKAGADQVSASALVDSSGLTVTKSKANPAHADYDNVGGKKYIGLIEAAVVYFDSTTIP